ACVRLAAGGVRHPRGAGGLAHHVLGARRRLRALGRDRTFDRAFRRSAAVRAQKLHADHPLALRHAAGHHPAAVPPLFRHPPRRRFSPFFRAPPPPQSPPPRGPPLFSPPPGPPRGAGKPPTRSSSRARAPGGRAGGKRCATSCSRT